MAEETKRQMPVSEGLQEVGKYIQKQYIAEMVGMHRNAISRAISHVGIGGRVYYLPERNLFIFNDAIQKIAEELRRTRLSFQKPKIVAEQIMDIRPKFNMTYITVEMMGRSACWLKRRTGRAEDYKDYNSFNNFLQEDLDEMNATFVEIANILANIELVSDRPQI